MNSFLSSNFTSLIFELVQYVGDIPGEWLGISTFRSLVIKYVVRFLFSYEIDTFGWLVVVWIAAAIIEGCCYHRSIGFASPSTDDTDRRRR